MLTFVLFDGLLFRGVVHSSTEKTSVTQY
jgi:hypothetical protein